MLAALRSCGGKASVCECKQNKLQTGQNPHLAVEPAAPAVLCREKMCWLFQISRRIFLHSKRYFFALFRRSCQQSPLVQSTRKGKFNITSQIRNYFCTIFENVSHQERFRDKFDRPPALSADSSSLLKPPDGAGLIFLSTRDSCFIYRLGCSQCCLCVCLQWAVRSWKWQILRRGSAVQTHTTSWQSSAEGANWSSGCRTIGPGCATRPGTLPADTWPHHTPSLPCSPPDTPPPRPPLNSELAPDTKGSCATRTRPAHSCYGASKERHMNAHPTTCLCCLSLDCLGSRLCPNQKKKNNLTFEEWMFTFIYVLVHFIIFPATTGPSLFVKCGRWAGPSILK